MKPPNTHCEKKRTARELREALMRAALLGVLLLSSVPVAFAQAYGVARRTTAVRGPNGGAAVRSTTAVRGPNGGAAVRSTTAVRGPSGAVVGGKTTVVAGGALPRGYISALPRGYRPVYVTGIRYYTVGGVYYRPQIYGGRTVYVAVRL